MKPKLNYSGIPKKDQCQTPPYSLDPLLLHVLDHRWIIWEPACGEGYLVEGLEENGFKVHGTDILTGLDFLTDTIATVNFDCIVTNPPYSIKYKWLERCYEIGKPFALLMPLKTLGAAKAQKLFEQHGLTLILLNKRVNFKMPDKSWNGGGAQFPVAWFCWEPGQLENEMIFEKIYPVNMEEL